MAVSLLILVASVLGMGIGLNAATARSGNVFEVVCEECPDPKTRRAPRRWKEQCPECAENIAEVHRHTTGHHVQVFEKRDLSPDELLSRDSRTVRVAGKAGR